VVNQLVIFTSTINPSIGFGIGLCFALLGADLMRVTFYSISWALNVRLVHTKKKQFKDINYRNRMIMKEMEKLVNVMRFGMKGLLLCLLPSSNQFENLLVTLLLKCLFSHLICRTTVRSRSAIALVLFRKLVKLKSLKEKTAGEVKLRVLLCQ